MFQQVETERSDLGRGREEPFLLLFEANPVPMWIWDHETLRFLAVNDAAIAHYGYSREQFMGMTPMELKPAKDHGGIREIAKGWMNLPIMIESILGTLLFGLFIVAFSRKVIR